MKVSTARLMISLWGCHLSFRGLKFLESKKQCDDYYRPDWLHSIQNKVNENMSVLHYARGSSRCSPILIIAGYIVYEAQLLITSPEFVAEVFPTVIV